ncbi:hydrogenase accessory protein HypB, putative [Psychromonas sp. CNPT3]|uniref:hydrogenase nickel incorporation protein HypB n=1 Tax=Psychromonas sp. CNPT3 TaxID=314282 RepID=UPI00006E893B|nr:hydrogenase nickel incorporation protein HypB [Psychromonas sp. CNPT3]AGH82392.1 hydrogenase accessory protein HypB, putative [Psychromonas sp. CNPT3]
MCGVCGCGDTKIEGHDHHSHVRHDEDRHEHEGSYQELNEYRSQHKRADEVHHHYPAATQVIIHHHHYYVGATEHQAHGHSHADQHSHAEAHYKHHHAHPHHTHEESTLDKSDNFKATRNEKNDLHYGGGEAGVHVPGISQRRLLKIETDILDKNNQLAKHNRAHFKQEKQLVLNLVSSPGSGKTTLLTETLHIIQADRACAVIEGDQQTSNDADRVRATGVPAVQVNTGKGCHLDAKMVHDAYHQLQLSKGGLLFIENVGNLVCPASFDLGEKYKVAILSVTEGEDKPLKYPNMFAASQLMIINKIDLLPYVTFDVDICIANAKKVNPYIKVITLSATTGEGMQEWLDWLKEN